MYSSLDYNLVALRATSLDVLVEVLAEFHTLARELAMTGVGTQVYVRHTTTGYAVFTIKRRKVVASRPLLEQICPN